MHQDQKSGCDMKQSTLGSIFTIFHPLTMVRGQNIYSNDQQAKFVDHLSILSPGKT